MNQYPLNRIRTMTISSSGIRTKPEVHSRKNINCDPLILQKACAQFKKETFDSKHFIDHSSVKDKSGRKRNGKLIFHLREGAIKAPSHILQNRVALKSFGRITRVFRNDEPE